MGGMRICPLSVKRHSYNDRVARTPLAFVCQVVWPELGLQAVQPHTQIVQFLQQLDG